MELMKLQPSRSLFTSIAPSKKASGSHTVQVFQSRSTPRSWRQSFGRTTDTSSSGCNAPCCCCFELCPCIRFEYLKSCSGLIKITTLLLGFVCHTLLIDYGLEKASKVGENFQYTHATVAGCMLITLLLIVCYVTVSQSQNIIRSSILEMVLNATFCGLYLGCGYYLYLAVFDSFPYYVFKWYMAPRFWFSAYPFILAACGVCGIIGCLFVFDVYLAYRYYRGYR